MKKLLSVLLTLLFTVPFTACGEKKYANSIELSVQSIDGNTFTSIRTEGTALFDSGATVQGVRCSLNVADMTTSLAALNPDYVFQALNDRQILMVRKGKAPYFLFTKNVVNAVGDSVDDVYIVLNESGYANMTEQSKMTICIPYHLTKTYFTLTETADGYGLEANSYDPFYTTAVLQTSSSIFTDIAAFYQDCGYAVQYEGGNTSGGCIGVYENESNLTENELPLFKILVMTDGNNRFGMRYCQTRVAHELETQVFVGKYVDALNTKNAENYLDCYETIDENSANVFLNSVKSCRLNSSEVFWLDSTSDETVLKVDYNLTSENGKLMGSYGTGEINVTEFWLIKPLNGGLKIACSYAYFGDTLAELNIYKRFLQPEETDPLAD